MKRGKRTIFIGALVGLLGYSGTLLPAIAQTVTQVSTMQNDYAGVWEGSGSQGRNISWSIRIDLSPNMIGEVSGSSYRGLSGSSEYCGGELTLKEIRSNSLVLTERITSGSRRCDNGGTLVIAHNSATTAEYQWFDSMGIRAAHGSMTRPLPVAAIANDDQTQVCELAIQESLTTLRGNRPWESLRLRHADNVWSTDHPPGRDRYVHFSMGGRPAVDVFNSPQLMMGLSENIIEACPSVGMVSFQHYGSDEARTYGIMHNGQIQFFPCTGSIHDTSPRPWGTRYCV